MSGPSKRDRAFLAAGIKLGVFTVISVLVTGLLAVIMGNIGFGDRSTYHAIFTSATSLEKGDDVRVAGVTVGEVREVEIYERTQAKVTFDARSDVPLTTASIAEVRYLNLVGDRYLALLEGPEDEAADAASLDDGDTIDVTHTKPALDLNVLLNGFKPLFQALEPAEVNKLSVNIVQVLQGEGGTVEGLLQETASFTNALADRDQLIGEVITNLSTTLGTVSAHRDDLEGLLVELRRWFGLLARDREVIGGSLDRIADLTVEVADLLKQGRPLLKADIAQLRRLAQVLNRKSSRRELVTFLDDFPKIIGDQTRLGTYGSWYNYYLCDLTFQVALPELPDLPIVADLQQQLGKIRLRSKAFRCNNNGGAPSGTGAGASGGN